MLREFAWKAFERTGNVDAYVFYREIEEKNKISEIKKTTEEEVAISG